MKRLVPLALLLAVPASAQSALTAREASVFRTQVQACWMLKEDAAVVMVGFSLDQSGRPDADSVKLLWQGRGIHLPVPDVRFWAAGGMDTRLRLRNTINGGILN